MARHLSLEELQEGLSEILRSPQDEGIVRAIVIRPEACARDSLQQCELSPEGGVHGDNWARGCWMSLPDGRPHPDVQVTLMNARTIALIAQDEGRWPLAGDNLFVDLDLSGDNLPPGTRLSIGSALLEITPVPHKAAKNSRSATASTPPASSTRATACVCTCAASTPGSWSAAWSRSAMRSRSSSRCGGDRS